MQCCSVAIGEMVNTMVYGFLLLACLTVWVEAFKSSTMLLVGKSMRDLLEAAAQERFDQTKPSVVEFYQHLFALNERDFLTFYSRHYARLEPYIDSSDLAPFLRNSPNPLSFLDNLPPKSRREDLPKKILAIFPHAYNDLIDSSDTAVGILTELSDSYKSLINSFQSLPEVSMADAFKLKQIMQSLRKLFSQMFSVSDMFYEFMLRPLKELKASPGIVMVPFSTLRHSDSWRSSISPFISDIGFESNELEHVYIQVSKVVNRINILSEMIISEFSTDSRLSSNVVYFWACLFQARVSARGSRLRTYIPFFEDRPSEKWTEFISSMEIEDFALFVSEYKRVRQDLEVVRRLEELVNLPDKEKLIARVAYDPQTTTGDVSRELLNVQTLLFLYPLLYSVSDPDIDLSVVDQETLDLAKHCWWMWYRNVKGSSKFTHDKFVTSISQLQERAVLLGD